MITNFKGKTAVLTGAGSGFGRFASRRLSRSELLPDRTAIFAPVTVTNDGQKPFTQL